MLPDHNINADSKSSLPENNLGRKTLCQHVETHHIEHCISEVMPEGGSLYYALLFCSPNDRTALIGLNSLVKELRRSADAATDERLFNVKINWWKNEIKQCIDGNIYLPSLVCLGFDNSNRIGLNRFSQLIDSLAIKQSFPKYFSIQERDQDALSWSGTIFEACAIILRIDQPSSLKNIKKLGACFMNLNNYINTSKTLSNGWHPFPVEVLQKYGVSAEQLRQRKSSPAFFEMVTKECQKTVELGESAWQSLSTHEKHQLHPLRTLWRIRLAEWKLCQNSASTLLLETNRTTPLHKLWLAWSTYILRR